jgi:barstar (barnase inhibitor)
MGSRSEVLHQPGSGAFVGTPDLQSGWRAYVQHCRVCPHPTGGTGEHTYPTSAGGIVEFHAINHCLVIVADALNGDGIVVDPCGGLIPSVGPLTQLHAVFGGMDVAVEAVKSQGVSYFGRNLDAFADCLSGGPGMPEDDDFAVEWRDHEVSRQHLGYAETVRQLEIRLSLCHPTNKPAVRADLENAHAGRGPTVFEWLVEIFNDKVPGALRLR